MIEHVYRNACAARTVDGVIVATDDIRIANAVTSFGGVAWMTSPDHPSATDRLAEVAAAVPCGLVVNVQGDEPLLEPAVIDQAVAPLLEDASIAMGTLARRIWLEHDLTSPHVVKVVTDASGFALYFSRSPLPFAREGSAVGVARAHIGLYVYRRDTLLRLAALPPSALERLEALEQLRALEHGIRIKVIETQSASIGVDTADDLERVRHRLQLDDDSKAPVVQESKGVPRS